jgi:hypothetical protein
MGEWRQGARSHPQDTTNKTNKQEARNNSSATTEASTKITLSTTMYAASPSLYHPRVNSPSLFWI